MKIERFEEIEAWKEARELVKIFYSTFCKVKDFGSGDQIQRASISVMSNIAEGFDRGSNKEFIQYLIIARDSLSELISLSYNALDLGYITTSDFDIITNKCYKVSNFINSFIRYLKN